MKGGDTMVKTVLGILIAVLSGAAAFASAMADVDFDSDSDSD